MSYQDDNGEIKEGKRAIIAITLSKEKGNTKINTFFPGQKLVRMRPKRKGKLLYPKKEQE